MENLVIYLKILLAILAGGIIGFQREKLHKFAGLRTHILVCAGTALLTAVGIGLGSSVDTIGRIIAGIVTGMGFIGAGTIISSPHGNIHGLTSAATIWITGIIGIVIGVGYYLLGITAAVFTVLILLSKHPIEDKIQSLKKSKQ